MKFIFSLATILFSTVAWANCAKDLKSPINLKPKYFLATTAVENLGDLITQAVVLKNGQKVTYVATNDCKTFSYSFIFAIKNNIVNYSNVDLAETAIQLLSATPTTKSLKYQKTILLNALTKGLSDGDIDENNISLKCGDAECTIGGTSGIELENDVIIVSYETNL